MLYMDEMKITAYQTIALMVSLATTLKFILMGISMSKWKISTEKLSSMLNFYLFVANKLDCRGTISDKQWATVDFNRLTGLPESKSVVIAEDISFEFIILKFKTVRYNTLSVAGLLYFG